MKFKYITIAVLVTALMSGCASKDSSDDKQPEHVEELPKVEIAQAHIQDVPQINSYTANVEADNTNNISPAAYNRIKTIKVDVGDRVRRGEVVVTLDRANAEQLKINLDQIKREYDRTKQLLEIGAGTQQSVDQ
ncbi:MAG: efflux transporter periplasmic adaptor subunit, partial [Muribaculaceae bacterium]|nr:efflux transporter periplasmic adaptor subunit [Muribaculaceae bacterium]